MKRIFNRRLAALILLCALMCAGCQNTQPAPPKSGRLSIVATVFPCYDFARAIGGDLCDVRMLITPGTEPHGYDPTLADAAAVQACDLLILGGGESDAWVQSIVQSADTPVCQVQMMDFVALLPVDEDEDAQGGAAQAHDHDGEWDEHVWTSPKNAIQIAQGICQAMCQADPDNARAYQDRLQAYQAQLESLDREFEAVVDHAGTRTLVFADRFPFQYFANDYGLSCYSALHGCSAVTEPSLTAIAGLIDVMRSQQLNAVLYLEFSDGKTAQAVAQATGAQTLRIHSCHNVTAQQWADGATYLTLMQDNLDVLALALNP